MTDTAKPNRMIYDLDMLRTVVMVADCGSFTTAAARLHSTQSTVSQKVRRLEEMVGQPLLDRSNREVHPTDAGETLLGYARHLLEVSHQLSEALAGGVMVTVRIGLPDDFVAGKTIQALAAFNRQHPKVKLEITGGLSRDLMSAYDRGELDLVLVKQRRHSREANACQPERIEWVDSTRFPCFAQDPIPLVTFPPRGLYRDDMIGAIEAMGRNWRIGFTSSSLAGIQEAVANGLGVSLLPFRVVTPEHRVLGAEQGFKPIKVFEAAIFHRPTADPMVTALAEILTGILRAEAQ
ncbi:LysR substrate-binding domain-containing protein [Pseudomonas sp. PSKL.D1]|uniref:LysR substrate-binding domain-containing protein n=1 Tax=Pseudomonas sp. PSKL.D1 TaxID=3029060 RepID=UPI0023817206|nr:LysR substrate-binding domain-containing protein [Pseudomonas sp. PSKL.D1]WDY59973.1 LysR substrate-binding domain-containing protein [Pseudomonas sp. PSKL.D1]